MSQQLFCHYQCRAIVWKKTSPDWSFCNSTSIFIINLNVLTSFHKMDDFEHALSSSADVDHDITGSVWRFRLKLMLYGEFFFNSHICIRCLRNLCLFYYLYYFIFKL
jgi:hypothetical protein